MCCAKPSLGRRCVPQQGDLGGDVLPPPFSLLPPARPPGFIPELAFPALQNPTVADFP